MVRAVRLLATAFNVLAAGAVVFLMLNVAGGVLVRTIHALTGGAVNLIWSGSIEMAVLALTVVVFASLHRAFVLGAIKVDVFTQSLPHVLHRLLDGAYGLVYAVFAGGMTWQFYHTMRTTFERGDATQDLLIPMFYIYAFLMVASAGLAIVATVWSIALMSGLVNDGTAESESFS